MGWIDGQGRENRQSPLTKKSIDVFELFSRKPVIPQEFKALGRHGRADALPQATVLPGHQLLRVSSDLLELIDRPHAIGCKVLRRAFAQRLFANTGHAHHEEFIEIRTENRQKLQPLHERIAGILGFLKHAEIKLQPAQFPIDERIRTDCALHFIAHFCRHSRPLSSFINGCRKGCRKGCR